MTGFTRRVLSFFGKNRSPSPQRHTDSVAESDTEIQQPHLTRQEIQKIVRDYVASFKDGTPSGTVKFSSTSDAQIFLDEIWMVLDSPVMLDATTGGSPFFVVRNKFRKLSLQHANEYNILPSALFLRNVRRIDSKQHGAGSFSTVYCGIYDGHKVALKQLKVYVLSAESEKQKVKKAFYRESILWKGLVHDHIVPFLGVSDIEGTVCMVLPWYERGSVRDHLNKGRETEEAFVATLNNWFCQIALGLAYLHNEGIVHGDLHGGNVLIDENGNARLTDFGLSLIADASSYNYGSTHGGGAFRWQAPELIDPEAFKLNSSRPTTASDIFSFACTGVEMYTGKAPVLHLNTLVQVARFYVSGQRPPRPYPPEGVAISDQLWVLIESCWAHEIAARPSAERVVKALSANSPHGLARISPDVDLVHTLDFIEGIHCVRFSNNGKRLAVGGVRGGIYVYDAENLAVISTLRKWSWNSNAMTESVCLVTDSVCFSPDDTLLATCGDELIVRVWDIAGGKMLYANEGHDKRIMSLDFSQDKRLLVSGALDGTVYIWVVSGYGTVKDPNFTHESPVFCVRFSPDSQLIAACYEDGYVGLCNVATGNVLKYIKCHQAAVKSLTFTPDGHGFVTGSRDQTVKYWLLSSILDKPAGKSKDTQDSEDETADVAQCAREFLGHEDNVRAVAVYADRWIASGSKDGEIRFWDMMTGELQCTLQGQPHLRTIDLSSAGTGLATCGLDGKVRIWKYHITI